MITVYAPAKVNLVLEVLGKEGAYHRISSIVQAVDLCDVVEFELDAGLLFACDEATLERDNLVMEAAALLKESSRCSLGARIELRKRIPWDAGLGGGSSDAAATLLGLNQLWGLGLSLFELSDLAADLGSDVPFFLHKGTALVEGKGEKVTPLPPLPASWFVLLVPPLVRVPDKTKQMYGRLNAIYYTEGQFVEAAVSVLRQGRMIGPGLMFNVFQKVAFDFFPELINYRNALEQAGAPGVGLAGSGPCLFAFFPGQREAGELYSRLRRQGLTCYLASCFG
ncbi:MAG: 4-(cytidine 5'-diphospho)-2-C-methyl-D-erythritol kinase [Dehalococcoidia bacterium]